MVSLIVHLSLISIYLLMILIYFIPMVIYSILSKMLIENSVNKSNKCQKKISRGIGVLSKIRHFVNTKTLVQLYHASILPFLPYGCIVWGMFDPEDIPEDTSTEHENLTYEAPKRTFYESLNT